MDKRLLGCVMGMGLSFAVHAASLTVVEDAGGVPAAQYFDALKADAEYEPPARPAARPLNRSATEADMLPVKSSKLSPGKVQSRKAKHAGLMQPVFLVGADRMSVLWLKQRENALDAMNAIGFAVDVPDINALTALREVAPGLQIVPVSGDDLAGRFGLTHYPVLITPTSIEQ